MAYTRAPAERIRRAPQPGSKLSRPRMRTPNIADPLHGGWVVVRRRRGRRSPLPRPLLMEGYDVRVRALTWRWLIRRCHGARLRTRSSVEALCCVDTATGEGMEKRASATTTCPAPVAEPVP